MSIDWLPPHRRGDSPDVGEPTGPTKPEEHDAPALTDLLSDDPVVLALISSTPPTLADPLPPPPFDDLDHETPPPVPNPTDPQVIARKEQMRVIANAELLRAYGKQPDDEASMSERLFTLELWKFQADLDLKNLRAQVQALTEQLRDEMRRRSAG